MESSACHRRASDAEQSALPYSMTVECDPAMVKEEPEWDECEESEAAAAGLYASHEIKDELVGSEQQLQQDFIFSMHDMLAIKEEALRELKSEGGAHAYLGNSSHYNSAEQYGLRSCYVKLERLPEEEVHISWPFYVCRDCKLVHCLAQSHLIRRSRRRKKGSRRKRR